MFVTLGTFRLNLLYFSTVSGFKSLHGQCSGDVNDYFTPATHVSISGCTSYYRAHVWKSNTYAFFRDGAFKPCDEETL